MSLNDDYTCAVSGIAAPPAEHSEGDLDDLPPNWSRVSIATRKPNPAFADLEEAEAALVEQQMSMLPADVDEATREQAERLARTMARATLAALRLSTPRYLTVSHEVDVSGEQIGSVLELLGLEDEQEQEEEE